MNMRRVAVVLSLTILAGCGGSTTSPTGPGGTSVVSLTVTSTSSQVLLGASETFTVTGNKADNTTAAVSGGTWSSDALGVATVEAATGRVTGVSSGAVTVSVDAQGLRGSKLITVRPNYQGVWIGTFTVNSCAQTGDWVGLDYCSSTFAPGASLPQALSLTQSQATVTGQTAIISDQFVATMTPATIQGNGSVTVLATFTSGTLRISQVWNTNITQAGHISGTLAQTWSDTTMAGQLVANCTLSDTTPSTSATASRFGAMAPVPPELLSLLKRIRR